MIVQLGNRVMYDSGSDCSSSQASFVQIDIPDDIDLVVQKFQEDSLNLKEL